MKKNWKNICLIGFMGVGKTSVGQKLAEKLSVSFYDTDQIIEKESGLAIPEIFETHGEAWFRQKEEEVSSKILQEKNRVIAIGGGAYVNSRIQKAATDSLIICLSISFESFLKKLEEFKQDRPLLKNKSTEEIEELYNIRAACYAACDFDVDVDELTVDETVEKILEFLKYRKSG